MTRRNFVAELGFVSVAALAACGNNAGNATAPATDAAKATSAAFDKLAEVDGNFAYNAAEDGVELHHSNILSPAYYVFAGAKDADGAAELVGQLGLAQSIEKFVGSVVVVNPADGKAYADADADTFAAVGGVSGPGIDKDEISRLAEDWDGPTVPFTYLCGDHDFFGMIPVDGSSKNAFVVDDEGTTIYQVDPRVPIFPIIQAYQKVNGLEVAEDVDLSKNEWYGIEFDEVNDIMLGDKSAQEGVLVGADGEPIMKLVAIKDQAHWNWKPEAAYLWEFFKNFSR